jgi:molybdate transport system substrate-binding protein
MSRNTPRPRSIHFVIAALFFAIGFAPVVRAQDGSPNAKSETVTVFAAASVKNVLDDAKNAMLSKGGGTFVASFAASSALAKQIEQGAPADLFISADTDWMDYLAGKNLIRPDTRTILATNSLVLIAPAASPAAIDLKAGADLAALLGEGRLAVADIKAVPAGKYAKAALENMEVWASVEGRLAQAENVRAALALVSRGEAPLGIVYGSDARSDSNVRIVATIPAGMHPPIVYPAAVTANARSPAAAASLLGFLASSEGRALFVAQGFGPPD